MAEYSGTKDVQEIIQICKIFLWWSLDSGSSLYYSLKVRDRTTKLTIAHVTANFPFLPDNNHPAGIAGSILVPELKHSILISRNLGNLILKQHIQLQSFCKVMEVTHLETILR